MTTLNPLRRRALGTALMMLLITGFTGWPNTHAGTTGAVEPAHVTAGQPGGPGSFGGAPDQESCGAHALSILALACGKADAQAQRPTVSVPGGSPTTLADLDQAATALGLAVTPSRRSPTAPWAVPCIMHWRLGHFSAVVARAGDKLLVDDPIVGGRVWCDSGWLERQSSGHFLVLTAQLDAAWSPLTPAQAACIEGGQRIYPLRLYDDDDEECPTDEELSAQPMDPEAPSPGELTACPGPEVCPPGHGDSGCGGYGMPTWRVSEPLLNLWVKDTPLYYTMSNGRIMPLVLRYKQRGSPLSTNVFGFGNSWECSWLSYVDARDDGAIEYRVPGGGKRRYDRVTDGGMRGSRGEFAGAATGADGSTTYYLAYRSFSVNQLGQAFAGTDANTLGLLTEKRDPHGRIVRFGYVTNETTILLTRVVDYDGKVSELSYTNRAFPRFVTSVRDPYGRQAHFHYDTNGNLARIIDIAGITNAFQYNKDGFLEAMVTPYGTTRFRTWSVESGNIAFPTSRSIEVTLPNGDRQIYAYHEELETTQVLDYYPDCPRVDDEVIEPVSVGPLNRRGSFFWNSAQLALVTNVWPQFNPEHYRLARWRHWDMTFHASGPRVGTRLLLERAPSPDGITDGHRRWFTYSYDAVNDVQSVWPSQVAERLPDGAVRYIRWQRNEWGLPVAIESTYSDGPGIGVRRTWLGYDATGCNLAEVQGPELDDQQWPLRVRTYAYNLHAQITNVVNALGETTTASYNPTNRNLTSVTYPSGLRVANTLASDGFLSRRVWSDARGTPVATNSFEWQQGRVGATVDARGLRAGYFWDALGRLTGCVYPDGTTVSNGYVKADGVAFPSSTGGLQLLERTRFKDRLGNSTFFTYNALGQLVAVTNALGGVQRYSWCNCGAVESVTDPLGNTTSFDHDLQGRLTAAHLPGGTHIRATYDYLGRLTNTTDTVSSLSVGYNHQGLQQTVANSTSIIQRIEYDALDRPRSVDFLTAGQYEFGYDALGRLLRRTEQQSGASEWLGYSPGIPWPTSYTNQLGSGVTLLAYDVLGRVTSQIQGTPEGLALRGLTTNRFTYTPAGDLLSLSDGLSRLTTWAYDLFGRPIRKVDAANRIVWTNGYDAHDQLVAHWTPARSNLTAYSYDALGRVTRVDFSAPTTADLTFAYDAGGRLSRATDGIGTTVFAWTQTGVLAREDGPWSDDTVGFTRDLTLALRTLSLAQPGLPSWVQTFSHDGLGRLTRIISPAGNFSYAYRGVQALVTSIARAQGATITREHDALGRLLETALRSPEGAILNRHGYEYDRAAQRTRQTFTDDNTLAYAYDPLGQLTAALGVEAGGAAREHERFSYVYDAAGNLTRRQNGANTLAFSVDSLNRLTSVTRGGSVLVAGMASRSATNVTVNGQPAVLYRDRTFVRQNVPLPGSATTITAVANDALGRSATDSLTVQLPGTVAFAHDAHGNLARDARRLFTFDDRDQLVALIVTNGINDSTLSEFHYDAFGRRRIRREKTWRSGQWVQTDEVRYVYAGTLVLQERGDDNRPRATYTRGPDLSGDLQAAGGIGGLLALSHHTPTRTDHFYYHADGSGNITALVDARHDVVARYVYDPFGGLQGLAGPFAETNLIRFSSKEVHPPSTLVYYGYRYYDPNLQRWISRDPLGEIGDVNLFRFVGNAPTIAVDPNGLFWDTVWDVGNVVWDAGKMAYGFFTENGDLVREARTDLALDGAAALIPFVPAGTTKALRKARGVGRCLGGGARVADDVLDIAAKNADVICKSAESEPMEALVRYYPPNDGFEGAVERLFLMPGQRIDRYGGSPYSRFFAPLGTPDWARSMPPATAARGLRTFEVVKPMEVRAGRIAPWFDQPGGGVQFATPVRLEVLLKRGILKEVIQ